MGPIGFVLLVLGIFGAVAGAWFARRFDRHLRPHVNTATTPIARTPRDCVVEIQGTVVASEQGVLSSPMTGRPAVIFHVEVFDSEGSVRTVYRADEVRAFWLDDGSGQLARIEPLGARLTGSTRYVERTDLGAAGPGVALAPLSRAGLAWVASVAPRTKPRYAVVDETTILLQQPLLALGHAVTGPNGELVLRQHPDHVLSLSTLPEHELVAVLGEKRSLQVYFTVGSVALALIGSAMLAWSLWG
jgi:hypothetical protein